MSTAAVISRPSDAAQVPATGRARLVLVEDLCLDCGATLAEYVEVRCADCADLALHGACRDCGAILRDADLDAGACADCTG